MANDPFAKYAESPEEADSGAITEDGQPEGGTGTLHIPSAILGGMQFKEGDVVTLRVVSSDEDGVDVEVEGQGGEAAEPAASEAAEPSAY